jgi:hypothetical protein
MWGMEEKSLRLCVCQLMSLAYCYAHKEVSVRVGGHDSHITSETIFLKTENESPVYPLVSVYLFILSVTKPVLSDAI